MRKAWSAPETGWQIPVTAVSPNNTLCGSVVFPIDFTERVLPFFGRNYEIPLG